MLCCWFAATFLIHALSVSRQSVDGLWNGQSTTGHYHVTMSCHVEVCSTMIANSEPKISMILGPRIVIADYIVYVSKVQGESTHLARNSQTKWWNRHIAICTGSGHCVCTQKARGFILCCDSWDAITSVHWCIGSHYMEPTSAGQAAQQTPSPMPAPSNHETAAAEATSGAPGVQVHHPSPPGQQPSTRAAQLRKQLYDPDAKLVDLFGDLEPKLMLDEINQMFWAARH